MRIVTENRDKRIDELVKHLEDRDYMRKIINQALFKVFAPKQGIHNPHHLFDKRIIKDSLDQD